MARARSIDGSLRVGAGGNVPDARGFLRIDSGMFASLFYAVGITAILTVIVWVAVVVYRWNRPKVPFLVFFGCLLTPVLFVPGCMFVELVVGAVIYGDFHYDEPSQLAGAFPLPAPAREITWHRADVVNRYRFKVSEAALSAWFDDVNAAYRDRPDYRDRRDNLSINVTGATKALKPEMADIRRRLLEDRFRSTDWALPSDLRAVGGFTYAANGAGMELYYSDSEGRAYFVTNSR